ncbi:hypothetical protein E4U54_004316, partial [Claviceps lovelessii]
MASSGIDSFHPPGSRSASRSGQEKQHPVEADTKIESRRPSSVVQVSLSGGPTRDATHRKLKSRHIQLIGIGGTIGTALY